MTNHNISDSFESLEAARLFSESPLLSSLVGKSNSEEQWLPLWMHALDTAGVFQYLLSNWVSPHILSELSSDLSSKQLLQLCTFLALTHDIGKITIPFQKKITTTISGACSRLKFHGLNMEGKTLPEIKHSAIGEAILIDAGCPIRVASVVGAHHGTPTSAMGNYKLYARKTLLYIGDGKGEQSQNWKRARQQWLQLACNSTGFEALNSIPEISFAQQILLSGLLIMADWIASNEDYFPLLSENVPQNAHYPERIEVGCSLIKLADQWLPEAVAINSEIFTQDFGFKPNLVQEGVLETLSTADKPGLLLIEAPMGCGKTEAALSACEIMASKCKCSGLFFGLPTQATANGIFPRLLNWAEHISEAKRYSIRLAHHMAQLNENYLSVTHGLPDISEGGIFVHDWFTGRKKTLLSDIVIGTVDQFLMASLKQKHVMLRHLGLAGKVAVLDECHAYDAYMNTYMDRTLEWLAAYHIPVVLLSATLPAARRLEMVNAYLRGLGNYAGCTLGAYDDYPLLTWTDGTTVAQKKIQLKEVQRSVTVHCTNDATFATILSEKLAHGGCAGIICNTVHRAQAIADQVHTVMPEKQIMLCHAQFLSDDRAVWEKELIRRLGKDSTPQQRDGLIVIGSPVLEQSLDIDFDIMISDLCPMDLLLQRVGRLQRHTRERPMPLKDATLFVLTPEDDTFEPGAVKIYGEWLLRQTRQNLPKSFNLPGDISPLVQVVYKQFGEDTNESVPVMYKTYINHKRDQHSRACAFLLAGPEDSQKELWSVTSPLNGWLDADAGDNDEAEAVVRDSITSIEVLVLLKHEDGQYAFLPWCENGANIPADGPLSHDTVVAIARQRLKLPFALTAPWVYDKTVSQILANHTPPESWKKDILLKNELFLFLNENYEAFISGYHLRYSKHEGLFYKKEEDNG